MIGWAIFRVGRVHDSVHGEMYVFGFAADQAGSLGGALGLGYEVEGFVGLAFYGFK